MTTEPTGPPAKKAERTWLVVALIMACACVAQAFGRFTWGVVLPGARDDLLDGSNTLAGFFGTLNVTAYLLGTLGVAWAASKMTLVGLIRLGLVVSTTSIGLAAIAPNAPVLGIAVFMMGIGGAIIWIPAPAIAVRALPPDRAGLGVGLIGSGIGVGLVFAGQLSAYLERQSEADDLWQRVYQIEFCVAVVVLIGAFSAIRSQGDRPSGTGGFGGIGALRQMHAWIPATVAYAAFGFAYILVLGFLVARLEDDSGFSANEAASMFSLLGASTVFGGAVLGPLSDRIGRRVTVTATFVVFAASTLLALTGTQPWVAIAAVGIGLMFSGMPALIIAHVVDHTDQATYGPAFSAATLAFGATQMISPQIGGAIADIAGSFTWVFVLSAVVSLTGACFASRMTSLRDAG